jgi:heat-inducible transcriptional repressor
LRHQFHQAEREVEDQAHLAASVLARLVHNAGIAIAPRVRTAKLRQAQLVSLHDQVALAVAVMEDGRICQSTVALPEPVSQDELTTISRRLNEALGGRRPAEFEELAEEATAPAYRVCREAIGAAVMEDLAREHTYLEGLRNVLSQPEFARSDRMLAMVEALDERNIQLMLPLGELTDGGINIVIGGENRDAAMQGATVIVGGYSGPAGMSGALGIVGPTRIEYARAIATVRYLSLLMGEMLEDMYR